MLNKTRALVLSQLKYGDSSLICKLFTEESGLSTIITSRSKGKKQKRNIFFQPFSCILVEVYQKPKQSIHRLKEVSFAIKTSDEKHSVVKGSIKFFLAELLSKLIKEEGPNPHLFNFLWEQAIKLNQIDEGLSYFHIDFLYELSLQLGIQPDLNTEGDYFDYREGSFEFRKPIHDEFANPNESRLLKEYFCIGNSLTKAHKSNLLNLLISYYRTQIGGFEKLKSKEVLEVVFS